MVDLSKLSPFIKWIFFGLSIGVFVWVTMYITKSFKSQCSSGYTFSKQYNKCIPQCGEGQTYYLSADACRKCNPDTQEDDGKGGCRDKCPEGDDYQHCGTQCYLPKDSACDSEKKVCPVSAHNPTTNKCCPATQLFNKDSQKCQECEGTICGTDCIGSGACIDGRACAQGDVITQLDKKQVCCPDPNKNRQCGGNVCCSDTESDSVKCNKSAEGGPKCAIECKDKDGNVQWCNKDTQNCFKIKGDTDEEGKSIPDYGVCVTDKCKWSTPIQYYPASVRNQPLCSPKTPEGTVDYNTTYICQSHTGAGSQWVRTGITYACPKPKP